MQSEAHRSDPAVAALADQVGRWLQPLDGDPAGANLEYELEFLEFSQAAEGKPETQFSAAEPPAWPDVRAQAEALFERTRDLRIALPWARAVVQMQGLVAVPELLRLLHGLLDGFWDHLHPELDPDDGDPFSRVAALATLGQIDGLLGDLRQVPLMRDRRLGGLRARDVEVAVGHLSARADEEVLTLAQVQGPLREHADLSAVLHAAVTAALAEAQALGRVMNSRLGIERAVDLKPLRTLLQDVLGVLPEPVADAPEAVAEDGGADDAGPDTGGDAPAARAPRAAGPMRVDSREDAIKAIRLVCEYLERHEPTNPAQFLLRRAQRLIDLDFLSLVKEFAPDAMNEVARVMGVDPSTLQRDD